MWRAGWMLVAVAGGCVVHREVVVEADDVTFTDPVSRVEVDLPAGDLEVRRGEGTGVEVRRTLRWSGEPPEVHAWVEGGALRLDVDCRPFAWVCAVDTEVLLPADAAVQATLGSGSVRVIGVDGDHAVSTGAGDLELRGLVGALSASTGSGRLLAIETGGALTLDAGSGDVSVERASAPAVVASTGSGDVAIDLLDPPERVWVESGSGDVALALPSGTYHLSLRTGSGGVSVDGVTADDGAPAPIEVETGAGDVSVTGR